MAQCTECPTHINNTTPNYLELQFDPYPPATSGTVDIYVDQNDARNGRYLAYQVSPTAWGIANVPALFCCDSLKMEININEKRCLIKSSAFAGCGPQAPPTVDGGECEGFLEHCQLEIEDFVLEQLHLIENSGCGKWRGDCNQSAPIKRIDKVGIGIAQVPSGYDLAVKGGIITPAVVVQLCSNEDWCDYVFEKDYALLSLDQVRAFIEQKQHLPGMPSAKEIEADQGFELKAIKMAQLEKLEEAYLYVLQTKARVDQLKEQVAQLRAENQELRKAKHSNK